MVRAFSRVYLNFLVVQINKMFTNPCRLWNLASLCVCTHLLVYVGCDDDRNFQNVSLGCGCLEVILRGAQYKSVIIMCSLCENQ